MDEIQAITETLSSLTSALDTTMDNLSKLNERVDLISESSKDNTIDLIGLKSHYIVTMSELTGNSEDELEEEIDVYIETFRKAFEEGLES